MEKYEQLKNIIESTKEDVEKFYLKGNKAAAARVRKAMQEVKTIAQELRINVQEVKNTL